MQISDNISKDSNDFKISFDYYRFTFHYKPHINVVLTPITNGSQK